MVADAVVMASRGVGEGLAQRPALRAWNAAHTRERKRMGLRTFDAYAQWLGVDPADESRWRRGLVPVPPKQGRRIVALFDHDPRWPGLWTRLLLEQERLALMSTRTEGEPSAFG